MGSVRDIDIEGPMTFIRFEEMSKIRSIYSTSGKRVMCRLTIAQVGLRVRLENETRIPSCSLLDGKLFFFIPYTYIEPLMPR